jgi:hypothetical protein
MDNGAIFCDFCGHELSAGSQPRRTPALHHTIATGAPAPNLPVERGTESGTERLPSVIVLQLATGQQFMLRGKADYTVGRIGMGREPPDVDLAQWYGYEAGVSREHLAIHVRREGVFVEDMDSRNETIHNGYRLMPRQWYPLHDGDEIRLGAIVLRAEFIYS